jgi:Flp pilus assembly protein TadB
MLSGKENRFAIFFGVAASLPQGSRSGTGIFRRANERSAKIERGIDPDAGTPRRGSHEDASGNHNHKIPVAGVGGLIFAVGIAVLAVVGLPFARWFLLGAVILAVGVVALLRWFRKSRPTEVEEVQLNVGRQTR